jgi:flagellar assembly factor FliW
MVPVQSVRFGTLEVPEDKIITMERPILGFENLSTFCLVEEPELAPFMCMQSCEDAAVAFVVVNPVVFFPGYRMEIAELRVALVESVETYVIVTLADNPVDISVNLQGPILINTENNLAKQLVLVNSQYQVRHYLLDSPERTKQTQVRERRLVEA